uniref:MYCBP-associated protein-like n=1 Tax=Phallusia mammillata TaxID=59560 RepID=A0A6F9DMA9_9ASCI|nr:MYCBP-associated protein-like [Phallusia mammillata]
MVGITTPRESGNKVGIKASQKSFGRSKSPPLSNPLDKGRKKGAPGTPDKPNSPGLVVKNPVINNEEIQKLAIKDEELLKLHNSFRKSEDGSGGELKKSSYAVRKARPQEQQKTRQTRKLVVAKPAPLNAPIKSTEYTGPHGPRYTTEGDIIPYSVLGPVHDFVNEAMKRNDIRPDSAAVMNAPKTDFHLEVKKYERPSTVFREQIPTAINQENALRNWQKKMADRKRQQGYISNLLQKPNDQLLMNQDDKFRSIQEGRKLIDRSIPAMDYGKGYRVGSEFWKQHESFGDDLTGIKMTLTKTERGSPVEFEHIGKPTTVKYEVGSKRAGERPTVDPKRTWQSSQYLKNRSQQLAGVMKELDPYDPDIAHLEVIGEGPQATGQRPHYYESDILYETDKPQMISTDPLSGYPDILAEPIIGPSIVFGSTPARWTGSSDNRKDQVGLVERVLFEAEINKRTMSYLTIENDGTTAVYYEWRKKHKISPFEDLVPDRVQRFYFNTGEGVILPGDTTKIPFIFKSPNAGIFSETWQFLTRPVLLGGSSLQIILKGIAMQDDRAVKDCMKLQHELEKREANVTVKKIIDDIIKGIQTPDRSPSPVDAYITEEEIFVRKNPGRFYHHETVMELKNIYLQLFAEEDRENKEWNLSLDELQLCVSAIPDEDAREELLVGLNTVIRRLSYPPMTPAQKKMHADGYRLWQEAIDNLVSCSMMVRGIMGLPEVIMIEAVHEPEPQATTGAPPAKPDPKDERKTAKGGKKGGGKDAKDDAKGKKGGKKNEKERPKSKDAKGKKQAGQSPTKDLLSSERDIASKTPSSMRTAPTDSLDPVTRKKYTEKMYSQVYDLLMDMVDKMTLAFEEANGDSQQLN